LAQHRYAFPKLSLDQLSATLPVWLYLLRCADGTLYTGIALDPDQRLLVHARGKGSKYVAARLPACIVYREGPLEHGEALRREMAVKKLSRAQKEAFLLRDGWAGASSPGVAPRRAGPSAEPD